MIILPMGTELFHADGQTDITNSMITFRSSLSGPKNGQNNLEYAQISNFYTSQ